MSLQDYWACRVCRSINAARSNRCYSCHTPREAAAVAPADLPTTGQAPPVEHRGTYQSTELRASVATVGAVAYLFASLFTSWTLFNAGELAATRGFPAAEQFLGDRAPVLALTPLFGLVALIGYAAWISRVVANLPALRLGYSRVSPDMAFIEPLIPGFNLYALPARMGEALRKLHEGGPGLPLLGLSWILFVIPFVIAGVVIRFFAEFEASGDLARTSGFALFLAGTLQAVGLAIGLYVLWRIEGLARARAEGLPQAAA